MDSPTTVFCNFIVKVRVDAFIAQVQALFEVGGHVAGVPHVEAWLGVDLRFIWFQWA